MFGKKNDSVWIVREISINTFGVLTTTDTQVCTFSSEDAAIEYANTCVRIFEEVHESIGDGIYKTVRLADDPNCKIVIARTFDRFCASICEKRILIEKGVLR